MVETKLGGDDVTVSDDDVLVKRALTSKDGWIIGMVRIESSRQERVLVHIVDEFPDNLPVETTGFKRGIKRDMNEISTQGVSIKQNVENEPVTVTYGIELAETVPEVEFEPPTIQRVEAAGPTQSAAPRGNGCEPSHGGGKEGEDFWRAATGNSASTTPMLSTMDETHDDPTVVAAMELASKQIDTESPEAPSDHNDDQGPGEGATGESDSLGAKPMTDSEGPHAAATTDRNEGRPTRRSIETRIDWLSARVDKFAAYSTALEELIDDHGTAPEFIDQIKNDLEDCEQQIQSVEDEVDFLQESHSDAVEDLRRETGDLDQRLDEAQQTFETEIEGANRHFGDKFEAIEADITAQSGAIGSAKSDIKALDDRITGVEADVDEIRDSVQTVEEDLSDFADELTRMREEFSALRAEINELSEFKESLAGVFNSRPDGPGQSTDT